MTSPVLSTLVYPLTIPQGMDWAGVNYTIVDWDGNPYDLTGCTATGQIRPFPDADQLYYTWSTSPSTGQGLITLTVETSLLNIRVLASESSPWSFIHGYYDLVITNPAAPTGLQVFRVAMGTVTVSPQVTF